MRRKDTRMAAVKKKASSVQQTQVYLSSNVNILDYDLLVVAKLDSKKLPPGSPKNLNKTNFSLTGNIQDQIDLQKLETETIPALAKKIGIDDFSFPAGVFPRLGKYLDLDLAFNYQNPTETQSKSYLVVFSIGVSDGSPPSPPSENDLQFLFYKNEENGQTTVGVEYNAPIHLPKAPSILNGVFDNFSISDLRGVYAGKSSSPGGEKIEIPAVTLIDPLTGEINEVSKALSFDIEQGFSLGLTLNTPGSSQTLNLAFPSSSTKEQQTKQLGATTPEMGTPATAAPTALRSQSNDFSKWFDVNKSFGPLTLQRLGIEFGDGDVALAFDASLKLAAFSLGLDGLSVGFNLPDIQKKEFLESLRIGLDGLSLAYTSGAISLSGGFLKTTEKVGGETIDQYVGEASISVKKLSISAIGSYAQLNGQPSLFIFALIDYPIGGPSYFFVTGVAAGFGYNQDLILPSQDQVANFPLVAAALDPEKVFPNGASDSNSLSQAAQVLNQYIPPRIGNQWIAAGIRFTSFEMIQSFALLTVSFGARLEVALLGLSQLQIPTPLGGSDDSDNSTVIAKVQMGIEVKIDPADGLIAVSAVISPDSFVFSKDCKLQGGFAFYIWFAGEHAGDFVVTLGGYNPNYTPPAWYPQEPRLGFNWQISSLITAKGGIYFALTPHALMAGGDLSIVFQDDGLRAWFIAYADFLIEWQPFHYQADIGVSIGVSYTLKVLGIRKTISVEIGASIALWGPSFGGKAHVHLWIVSFTISFGNQNNSGPAPLSFSEVKDALLPKSNPSNDQNSSHTSQAFLAETQNADGVGDSILSSIKISNGVLATPPASSSPTLSSNGASHSIVNAHQLQITTTCSVPGTELQRSTNSNPLQFQTFHTYSGNLYVKPMQSPTPMKSVVSVSVTLIDDNEDVTDQFDIVPITGQLPKALWSKYDGPTTLPAEGESLLLDDVPLGFTLAPKSHSDHTVDPSAKIPIANLLADLPNYLDIFWPKYRFPNPLVNDSPLARIEDTLVEPTVVKTRSDILKGLTQSGILSTDAEPYFSPQLLNNANDVFLAEPVLADLGQLPPA